MTEVLQVSVRRAAGYYVFRLLCLAAVIVGLRALFLFRNDMIANDGVTYLRMAKELASGWLQVALSNDYHLGFPIFIRAVHLSAGARCFGIDNWEASARVANCLLSVAATAGVFVMALRMLGWRTAWLAALLWGASLRCTTLGTDVLSDMAFLCGSVWAIVAAMAATDSLQEQKASAAWQAAVAGVMAGLAYWVRPEALLIVAGSVFTWLTLRPARRSLKLLGASIVTLTFSSVLVCLPYAVMIGGISKKKNVAELLGFAARDQAVRAGLITFDAWAYGRVLVALADAATPILAILAGVWLLVRIRRVGRMVRRSGPWRLMVVLLIGYAWLATKVASRAGYLDWRHMMLVAMVIAPYSAGLVVIASRWLGGKLGSWRWAAVLGATPVIAVSAGVIAQTATAHVHANRLFERQVAGIVRELAKPGEPVVSNSPLVVYYSGLEGKVTQGEGEQALRTWPEAISHLNPSASRTCLLAFLAKHDVAVTEARVQRLAGVQSPTGKEMLVVYRWVRP